MRTATGIIKLRELLSEAETAMVTTATPVGELHSRPLILGAIDDNGRISFLVDNEASWVQGLHYGDPVNVSAVIPDDNVWVSIAGTGWVTEDLAAAQRLWNSEAKAFFPGGIESPNLRVLLVDPSTCEYWDAPSSWLESLTSKARSLIGRGDALGESGSIDLG